MIIRLLIAIAYVTCAFILIFPLTGIAQEPAALHLTKDLLLEIAGDNLGQRDDELAEKLRILNPQYQQIFVSHDDTRISLELGPGPGGAYFRLNFDKFQLTKLALDQQNIETGAILQKVSQNSKLGGIAFQRWQPHQLSLSIALRPGEKAKAPTAPLPEKPTVQTPPPVAAPSPLAPAPAVAPPPAKTAKPPAPGEANTLWAVKTTDPPTVDGKGQDEIWQRVPSLWIQMAGASGSRQLELKACYTDSFFYLLARWRDNTHNPSHMTWLWDKGKKEYAAGGDRQDALSVMFAMKGNFSACMTEGKDFTADLWMWGAATTNPSGYAEDAVSIVSSAPLARANAYQGRWLKVLPDAGELPYKTQILLDYQGDRAPHYLPQTPTGSAADVRAKGQWQEQTWTVEFSRRLKTGHDDDVVFIPGQPVSLALALFDHREGDKHSTSKEIILRWK